MRKGYHDWLKKLKYCILNIARGPGITVNGANLYVHAMNN